MFSFFSSSSSSSSSKSKSKSVAAPQKKNSNSLQTVSTSPNTLPNTANTNQNTIARPLIHAPIGQTPLPPSSVAMSYLPSANGASTSTATQMSAPVPMPLPMPIPAPQTNYSISSASKNSGNSPCLSAPLSNVTLNGSSASNSLSSSSSSSASSISSFLPLSSKRMSYAEVTASSTTPTLRSTSNPRSTSPGASLSTTAISGKPGNMIFPSINSSEDGKKSGQAAGQRRSVFAASPDGRKNLWRKKFSQPANSSSVSSSPSTSMAASSSSSADSANCMLLHCGTGETVNSPLIPARKRLREMAGNTTQNASNSMYVVLSDGADEQHLHAQHTAANESAAQNADEMDRAAECLLSISNQTKSNSNSNVVKSDGTVSNTAVPIPARVVKMPLRTLCVHESRLVNTLATFIRQLYDLDTDEHGHRTRGHVVVSQSDRERAQRAKSDLLYGEVLPAGILRMMDSEHLQAEKASVLLDLGSGCGKLCVQTFHQYSNLQRVIGVELSEERVKLAMNALDRLEKLYAERASVKLSFANGIVSKGSLTLMNDWTTTTVPSVLNSDKRKTLPMSEEKDEMKTDEKTSLCSSMEIEQKIVDHSCGNGHQDNMDEKSSYALSHDSYQRRAPCNVLPTSRSLEFIVDDLFNFACEVNLADIVIAETKFEESRFEDICLMLSKMKPGARLLTYDSLPEMFLLSGLANKVIFPFTFIRNLPESMDRFEASWSPVNGHRFHLYRKLHPAELTECVLEEQRRMFEDHVQQMEQDKKARCMRQQMDAKSKAMAMAMDAQNSHNANPQHQHQQQQQQQHAVPPTQSVFRSRVVATAERSSNTNQYADNSNYRSARVSVAEGFASENSVSMSVSPTPAGTPSTSASFSSNSPPFSPASSPPVSHSPGVGLPSSSSLAQLQTTFDVMNRLTNSLVRMMEKSRKELSNTGNGIGIGIDSGKVHEEGVERIESEEHAYEQIDDDEDDEEDEDDDEEVEGDAEAGAEGGTQARR